MGIWNNLKEKLNHYFGGIIGYFFIYPFFLSILLTIIASTYKGCDIKDAITGIFNIYVVTGTIVLSVAFIFISIILPIDKRRRYYTQLKKANAIQINSFILSFSILGILFTIISHFLVSFSLVKDINSSFFYSFFIATFFIIGSIFGVFLLSEKIMNLWQDRDNN